MEPQQKNGALVGSVIIVLILIIGGIYMWQNRPEEKVAPVPASADDTANIEAEIDAMDLESLDEEI